MKKSMKDNPIKMELTQRGFVKCEFEDEHGEKCSLQKSSAMAFSLDEECIWLGIDNPEVKYFVPYEGWTKVNIAPGSTINIPANGDILHSGRMHLTRKQVKQLLPLLQHFVKTGELPQPEETKND